MHNTDHDVAPQQAVVEGTYIHSERKTRSDVTHPEVTAYMRVYWHSDDVSRATGNSGKLFCSRRVGVLLMSARCCFCTNSFDALKLNCGQGVHVTDVSFPSSRPAGDRDMFKESRKKDAPSHPRRQLMHKGDKVWRMFLKDRRYLALKAKLLKEDGSFTDPGRTTFLATRCSCLGGCFFFLRYVQQQL